jgi:hypothetical protein
MTANINEDELKLLTYLHEHVNGYGSNHGIGIKMVAQELERSVQHVRKDASYLGEHGLGGIHHRDAPKQIFTIDPEVVYLSGIGEDYMRKLEDSPSVARKLTVSVLSELWTTGKATILGTASQLLADYAKHFHH